MRDEDEAGLERIQAEWLELQERGLAPSPDALLAEHPDLAGPLRAWFTTLERLNDLVGDRSSPAAPVRVPGYAILREVGRGAMGVVYEARQESLGRRVALKVLSPAFAYAPHAVARFHDEAHAAARIRHPSLVPIYDVGEADGVHYYSMELVEGRSLEAEIAALRAQDESGLPGLGKSALLRYVERFAGVCEALHAAHERGVLHRDVKPSNILVAPDGAMKLIDFGLARQEAGSGLTRSGDLVGTPMYMSPEQIVGSLRDVDARSDAYALGITLYELVTLRRPYRPASVVELAQRIRTQDPVRPRSLGLAIPKALEAILYKAFDRDPVRRYPTAQAMAQDLRLFAVGKPVSAEPQTPSVRFRKWRRQHRSAFRTATWTLLATLFLGGGVLAAITWGSGSAGEGGAGETDRYERGARRLWVQAGRAGPAEAIPLLETVLGDRPRSTVAGMAGHRLGELRLADGDLEGAQVAWATAYALDPLGPAGIEALIALGRTLQAMGRLPLTVNAAERARARAPEPLRARALLLAAEAHLAGPERARGLGYLRACEARSWELRPAERARLAWLGAIVDRLVPSTSYPLGRGGSLLVGRLWKRDGKAVPALIVTDERQVTVHEIVPGRNPVRRLTLPPFASPFSLGVADVFGNDGLDEIIQITKDDALGDRQVLRIVSCASRQSRTVLETTDLDLPKADCHVHAADVNHDGRSELFLGRAYPGSGLDVIQFEDSGPVRMDAGDTVALAAPENNIRDLTTGDLDGNGKIDLVVACAEHQFLALKVFEFDGGWRRVTLAPEPRGAMESCLVLDATAGALPEVLFSLNTYFSETVGGTYAKFLRQGIHRLRYDAAEGAYRCVPVDTTYRIAVLPRGNHGLKPWSTGHRGLVVGRLGAGRQFLGAWENAGPPRSTETHYVVVRPLDADVGRGFVLRQGPESGDVHALDWTGDGMDELIVFDRGTGMLHVHGIGTLPAAEPIQVAPSPMPEVTDPISVRFEAARLLHMLGFHAVSERAYSSLEEDVADPQRKERAFLGTINALGEQGHYDECVRLLEARCDDSDLDRSLAAQYRLGIYLERLGRLGEAAAAYEEASSPRAGDATERDGAAKRAEILRPWRRLGEPIALPVAEGWSLPSACFRLAEEGILVHVSDHVVGQPVWADGIRWDGESFQLSFELRVESLDFGRNLNVGFFHATRGVSPLDDYLVAHVGSSTGQARTVSLIRKLPSAKSPNTVGGDSTPGRGLPVGVWHRFVLTYDGGLRRAWLAVHALEPPAEGRSLRVAVEMELKEGSADALRLGLGAEVPNATPEKAARSAYQIRRIRLARP